MRLAGHRARDSAGAPPGLILRLAGFFRRWGPRVVHTHNTKPLLYAPPAAPGRGSAGDPHAARAALPGGPRGDAPSVLRPA
jgi:hypothetical protein